MATIYLDADACPVRPHVYEVAARYQMPVMVVANTVLRIPTRRDLYIRMRVVEKSEDAADDWIVARVRPKDLVVTEDVILAGRVLLCGARCLDFWGVEFESGSMNSTLSLPVLVARLRERRYLDGPKPPYSIHERLHFAAGLDAIVRTMTPDHFAMDALEPENDVNDDWGNLDEMLRSAGLLKYGARPVDRFGTTIRRRSARRHKASADKHFPTLNGIR